MLHDTLLWKIVAKREAEARERELAQVCAFLLEVFREVQTLPLRQQKRRESELWPKRPNPH